MLYCGRKSDLISGFHTISHSHANKRHDYVRGSWLRQKPFPECPDTDEWTEACEVRLCQLELDYNETLLVRMDRREADH